MNRNDMNRAAVLGHLERHEAELSRRFGVASLTLFGSFARDRATDRSDVDILVSFDDDPDMGSFFGAQSYLEDVLGRTVDLVRWDDLREEIRPHVERDISMPDSPSLPREWRLYIEDMIGFCERILTYTEGLDEPAFLSDNLIYDATLRNIELIGEAANRIPEDVRDVNHGVPWGEIIGTRNRLAHAYRDIYDDVVWKIVSDDIPVMLPRLRDILEQPAGEPG